MKKLVLLRSLSIVTILGATLAVATSCDDDSTESASTPYVGSYSGEQNLLIESGGQELLNEDMDGVVAIVTNSDGTCNITVPAIEDLAISIIGANINMESFTIPFVSVAAADDAYSFQLDSYEVENVSCDLGRGSGAQNYTTTGTLSGLYDNGSLTLNYTFKLGNMPFPITATYSGNQQYTD